MTYFGNRIYPGAIMNGMLVYMEDNERNPTDRYSVVLSLCVVSPQVGLSSTDIRIFSGGEGANQWHIDGVKGGLPNPEPNHWKISLGVPLVPYIRHLFRLLF